MKSRHLPFISPLSLMTLLKKSLMAQLVGINLFLSVLTAGCLGYVAYIEARNDLTASVFSELQAVSTLKTDNLDLWISEQRQHIVFLAESPELRRQITRLSQQKSSDAGDFRQLTRLDEYMDFVKNHVASDLNRIFLLDDKKGDVIFSTDPNQKNLNHSGFQYFWKGLSYTNIQPFGIASSTNEPTLIMSTPVFGTSDHRLAVLVAEFDISRIDRLLSERTGLGKSGRIYMIDSNHRIISKTADKSQERHSAAIEIGLQGKSGHSMYKNYEGTPVLGVYKWLPELESAMIVEISQQQAFTPARHLAISIITAGVIFAVVLAVIIVLASRRITRPLVSLAHTATRIAEGQLDLETDISSENEIGILAKAFDRMTHQLRSLISDLRERAKELEQKNVRLQQLDRLKQEVIEANQKMLTVQQEAKEKLEMKVEERTRQLAQNLKDLEKAKMQAEKANQAKSTFLANMSHEIRTPMNAIMGLNHLALQTRLTARQQEYLTKIEKSANSLLRLIDDILDFSKIEAGKLDLVNRPFSPAETLESLKSVIGFQCAEKGLSFRLTLSENIPSRLAGDALRFQQVLLNLSANALKFTHQGGVSVAVDLNRETETEVILRCSVHDTGIGMSAEQVESLFQPFHQADASITRTYGGTGLGLAISRRLVEMMSGEFTVISEPNRGSTFTFTARFLKTEEEDKPAPGASLSADQAAALLAGTRLLLVEDNDVNRLVARELLKRAGIEVSEACDGLEAVQKVENEAFDAVLMDMQMPNMDGLTAAAKIRQKFSSATLPIFAMTANAMEEDRRKCLAAGMDDHIPKPIVPAELYEKLACRLRPDAILKTTPDGSAPAGVTPSNGPVDGTSLSEGDQPAGNVDKPVHDRRPDPQGEAERAKILIVDDEKTNLDILVGLFRSHYKIVAAKSGEQALKRLAHPPLPDLILLDMEMPGMDGIEVCRRIKDIPAAQNIPVILMPEKNRDQDAAEGIRLGAADCMGKPFHPVIGMARVKTHMTLKKRGDMLKTINEDFQVFDENDPFQAATPGLHRRPAAENPFSGAD